MQKLVAIFLVFCVSPLFAVENLVKNGNFSEKDEKGVLMYWSTSGAKEIMQGITTEAGFEGKGNSAKLTCEEFSGSKPDSHAMICQCGFIPIAAGKWHKLTFAAKQKGVKGEAISVALVNTKVWQDVGLQHVISVGKEWKRHEIIFRSKSEVFAELSRLQIWFMGTGELWLADVQLVEVADFKEERYPEVSALNSVNYIPNSSFECGAYGWGGFSQAIQSWGGKIFRLAGVTDDTTAFHGKCSLRIDMSPENMPVAYSDYFDLERKSPSNIYAANMGWIRTKQGSLYTLSAYMKSGKSGSKGVLLARKSDKRSTSMDYPLTNEWKRYEFSFKADSDYAWIAVGLDASASGRNDVAWIDAVQFEEGGKASEYKTREALEIMPVVSEDGNIFVFEKPPYSLKIELSAYNDNTFDKTENVRIKVTDFFDREVANKDIQFAVPKKSGKTERIILPVEGTGFYNITVKSKRETAKLRSAIINRYRLKDSRFGMNHAYSYPFLIKLAEKAGILWWRDWSTQWRLVQKERNGKFDFTEPDFQIDRVLNEGGNVLLMLPFPSADWNSTVDISKLPVPPQTEYQKKRIMLAGKPDNIADFEKYVSETVKHYRGRINIFQIFNESLYTDYSLPKGLGYKTEDYIKMLAVAYKAAKAIDPGIMVEGGVGAWPDNKWTKEFVDAGGLKYVDIMDVHTYPVGTPESVCEPLVEMWQKMKERGEQRPIWLTELGCYGEDEPNASPYVFGDETMQRTLQPDERSAAQWIVKFSAMFFANGGEKIFFHAGICTEINEADLASVFFKYGGFPRKIYPVIAAMAGLIPPEAIFDGREKLSDDASIYWFKTRDRRTGIAWSTSGEPTAFKLQNGATALDIFGNPLPGSEIKLSSTPCYITLH